MIPPSNNDWARWTPFARHVRHICDGSVANSWGIRHEDMSTIRLTQTTPHLFPLLVAANLDDRNIVPSLLSPTVNCLTITFTPPINAAASQWVRIPRILEICEKVLEDFQVLPALGPIEDFDHQSVIAALCSFFPRACRLKDVVVPFFYLTLDVFASLSGHRHLESVQLAATGLLVDPGYDIHGLMTGDTTHEFSGDVSQIFDSFTTRKMKKLELPPDCFPRLHKLHMALLSPKHALLLLIRSNFPCGNLTHLRLRFLCPHSASSPDRELGRFISAVADSMHVLRTLALYMTPLATDRWHIAAQATSIGGSDIMDIARIDTLQSLELYHTRPIMVTTEDIGCLLRSLPRLHTLILNPHPIIGNDTHLDLGTYAQVAVDGPNLRTLGLFIDASSKPVPPLPLMFIHRLSVETLFLGISSAPYNNDNLAKDVIRFLARLIPDDFHLAKSPSPSRYHTIQVPIRQASDGSWVQGPDWQYREFAGAWRRIKVGIDAVHEAIKEDRGTCRIIMSVRNLTITRAALARFRESLSMHS